MAAHRSLSEEEVFTRHYSQLCDTLTDVDNLLSHFVQQRVISTNDLEELNSIVPSTKKVQKLLMHISGPLKGGNSEVFYAMLRIMEEYGLQATNQLADQIRRSLPATDTSRRDSNHHTTDYNDHDQHSKQEPNKRSSNTFAIQFSMLLANIGCLLDDKCSNKLEKCKQFCCALKVSDESSELLFDDKQLKEINQCHTFHQLFASHLCFHLNWEQYFILESIIALTELKEAEEELDKYKKYMASKMGMKIISDTFSIDNLPPNSIKLSIIVDKPYTKLTAGEYMELKDFICTTLKIQKYVLYPYIRFFFESLHLKWYIPVQAARYVIKTAASLNISLFLQQSVRILKVGDEVLFDCTVKEVSESVTTASQSFGGYDYNFIESPPDRLVCKICCLPCCEAQLSICCGHAFCKSCLKSNFCFDSTNVKSTCPVCRADKFISFPQHQADREIKGLLIYCPNKESGCEWVGELNDIHKHIQDGKCCDVKCDKCDKTLLSTGVKSHLDTECPCYCPYCDITAEREAISSEHKEKCHKFAPACPNNIAVDNLPNDELDVLIDKVFSETSRILQNFIRLYLPITVAVTLLFNLGAVATPDLLAQTHYSISEPTTPLQAVQQYYYQLSLSDWSTKHRVLGELSNQVAPAIVKMPNFTKELENKEEWFSNPFFAFEGGYQMCLRVDAAGGGKCKGTHVSVQLYLMKGPHDDELEQSGHWPLRGTFTIELLNQLNDSDHHSRMVQFHHYHCKKCTDRVTGLIAYGGRGYPDFISHDTLLHHSNNSYHKNDLLIFRISYEHTETRYQIAPFTVKVTKFSYWLKSISKWYSSPFFAFEGGYQMCFKVNAAGNGKAEGTHVSVYLYLIKGPHDDELEQSGHWPLRGTFTIEILNQISDGDNHSIMVQFHDLLCDGCTNRVLDNVIANSGLGHQQFISHTILYNNGYMKSDSLIFRVSYKSKDPPDQIAPVAFKLTRFSLWVKNKQQWYSSPFFAFEGGYQMCLKVYAAGGSKGTHVSVFLFRMKGPHDDKLEQSGHWPLRGTFTIELLNQLNDSDHHICVVQFYHHLCKVCTNRVTGTIRTQAHVRQGCPQFISHDTLLHHSNNSYHKNDLLIFRISYEHTEARYQIAPFTVKVTKFSYWLKSISKWYSSPFFAFEEGYQMYLRVDAAGYGIGEGTHVSVYLYLMKGPHDDKLEQSGHWPLRGTFTIELLNQLNDSDHHYRYTVNYDAIDSFQRVKEDKSTIINAMPQFISHDTLFQHNSYLKNDILQFRMSYSTSTVGSNGNQ